MKVINPITITDSNMTSTIAEPSTGEVEWESDLIPWINITGSAIDICSTASNIYTRSVGLITKRLLDGSFVSSISSANTSSITSDGEYILSLNVNTQTIDRYSLDLVYFDTHTITGASSIDYIEIGNGVIFGYNQDSLLVQAMSIISSTQIGFLWSFTLDIEATGISAVAFNDGYLQIVPVGSTYSQRYTPNGVLLSQGLFYEGVPFVSGSTSQGGTTYAALSAGVVYVYVDDVTIAKYPVGSEVMKTSTHRTYRAAFATDDDPEIGVNLEIPTWVDIGPTNKYAAFDEVVSSPSVGASPLVIEITPGELFDSIVGLNISGATAINIMVTDPIEGVVYNKDIDMVDNDQIVSWSTYLWNDFVVNTSFAALDLPLYKNGTIKVTFTGAGDVSVGTLVAGHSVVLGEANYGSSVQQLSFNRVEEDDFGNVTIIKRPSAKLVNYDVSVLKDNLSYVYKQLEDLDGVNAVWLGTDDTNDLTIVYGYHRDNNIGIDTPTLCKVTIQVRGLI